MKNSSILLTFLLFATVKLFSQNTYVPDDNFELGLINLGYDSGELDDYVPTANISSITTLFLENKNIADLTGIEDFSALVLLDVTGNELTSLDVSLNLSLQRLDCYDNNLSALDMKNGNNLNFLSFNAQMNPNLLCINVDDPAYSTANWIWIDSQTSFGDDCPVLGISDISPTDYKITPNPSKEYISITNENSIQKLEIYNLKGQKVKTIIGTKEKYDISNLLAGMYILKIFYYENTVSTSKFIKN